MTYKPLTLSIPFSPNRTVAVAHTHPNVSVARPVNADFNSPVPNYVISRKSLYVTIPGTKRSRLLRRNWREPCSE